MLSSPLLVYQEGTHRGQVHNKAHFSNDPDDYRNHSDYISAPAGIAGKSCRSNDERKSKSGRNRPCKRADGT